MLLWLSQLLAPYVHFLRVFQYITFRSIISALTALLIVLLFSPRLIQRLVKLQIGQVVRDDGPQTHLKKTGTPTMGGVLIIIAVVLSVLLWADLSNYYVWGADKNNGYNDGLGKYSANWSNPGRAPWSAFRFYQNF